jgi:hypothetical protein
LPRIPREVLPMFSTTGFLCIMIRKVYRNHEKALTNCTFIVDLFGFQRCILSLTKVYYLHQFFWGMSAYHNSQLMADLLGVNT